MATLAEVVESIKQQNETLVDIRQVLAASLQEDVAARKVVERSRLDLEEERREAKMVKAPPPTSITAGVMQGLGVTPLQNFINNLLGNVFGGLFSKGGRLAGLLAGAIGLGAGKLIKWGVIGGLIASYFGDEIVNWLDPDRDGIANFGPLEIDLNDPLIVGGLVIAAGAITKALVRFVGGLFVSLGAAGLALVFRRAGLTGLAAILTRAARATSPLPGAGRAGPSTAEAARVAPGAGPGTAAPAARVAPEVGRAGPSTAEAARVANLAPSRLTLSEAQTIIRENVDRLPAGVRLTEQGRLLRETPAGPRFVSPIAVAEQMNLRPLPGPYTPSNAVRPTGPVPGGLPAPRPSWWAKTMYRFDILKGILIRAAGPATAGLVVYEFNNLMNQAAAQNWSQFETARAIQERIIGPFIQGTVLVTVGSAIGAIGGTAVGLPGWGTVLGLLAGGTAAYLAPNYLGELLADWLVGTDPAKYEQRLRAARSSTVFLGISDNPQFAGLIRDYITDPSTGALLSPDAVRMKLAGEASRATFSPSASAVGGAAVGRLQVGAGPQTAPIGSVSSARLGGQRGLVKMGQELSALDVLEIERSRSNAPVIINAPTDARTTNTSNTGFNIKPRLTAADVQRQAREGLLPRAGR